MLINKNAIQSVSKFDKKICDNFTWKDEKKGLFGKIIHSGFEYSNVDMRGRFTEDELKNGKFLDIKFLVIDNNVYYKPYIIVELYNRSITLEFESEEEMEQYILNLKKEVKYLIEI
jgi:hypothetical protein